MNLKKTLDKTLKVGLVSLASAGIFGCENEKVSVTYPLPVARLISYDGDSIPEVYQLNIVGGGKGGYQLEYEPTQEQIEYFKQNYKKE